MVAETKHDQRKDEHSQQQGMGRTGAPELPPDVADAAGGRAGNEASPQGREESRGPAQTARETADHPIYGRDNPAASREWQEHDVTADSIQHAARRLIELAGTPELAKQAIDAAGDR